MDGEAFEDSMGQDDLPPGSDPLGEHDQVGADVSWGAGLALSGVQVEEIMEGRGALPTAKEIIDDTKDA